MEPVDTNDAAKADDELIAANIEEAEYDPEKLEREDFLRLIQASDTFDPIADLKWVFHALGAKDLTPADAPSPGAWSLLTALIGDEMLLKNFYSTVYPKLLPNKSQREKEEGDRAEDGRKQFGIIERILLEPDDIAPVLSSAEERARQLAISSQSS